jgi:hypothetical protein
MTLKNDSDGPPDEAAPNNPPLCFGDPAAVCPKDELGFIQPQEKCLACAAVKECLQKALRAEGVLPTPVLETPAATRISGFFKRWSRQKLARTQSPGLLSDE